MSGDRYERDALGSQAAATEVLASWRSSYLVQLSSKNGGGARVLDAKAFNQAHLFSVCKRRRLSNYLTPAEKITEAKKTPAAAAAAAASNKKNGGDANGRRRVS
eukprot:6187402-Pleurochrysis_carterae.AAC.1